MARVTVEDCIDKVANRFELVLLASHRSRQIVAGECISVERDNDKNPVIALREIAEDQLSPEDLKEDLIHSLQREAEVDRSEDQMDDHDGMIADGNLPEPSDSSSVSSASSDDKEENAENKENDTEENKAAFDTLSQEEMLARLQELKPPEKADTL